MTDLIKELGDLLDSAGARVTVDFERSTRKPCCSCGSPGPHALSVVGHYITEAPVNLKPRDRLERPLCVDCRETFDLP